MPQPAQPQHTNYWAPLTHTRHIPPHPAQRQHTNDGAPRTRKRHQQEHRPQRPTERSDPTQHAKGRTGDCPGPRKGATTRRNVTRGGGGLAGPGPWTPTAPPPPCHGRRFKGERPIGAATGHQSQPLRPCASAPPPPPPRSLELGGKVPDHRRQKAPSAFVLQCT